MSTQNDFKTWFKEFDGKRRGSKPKNLDKWIEGLAESHSKLRERLGGERKEFSLRTEPSEGELSMVDYRVSGAVYGIINYLPKYLNTYNLQAEDLCKENYPQFNNIKVSKHISAYMQREKIDSYYASYIERYLATLGEIRATAKVPKAMDFYGVISTTPKAFTSIGSFGIDNGSCFRHGGYRNDEKRWHFASQPNTFVFLLKTVSTEDDEPIENGKRPKELPLVRMLGQYRPKDGMFCACSTYYDYDNLQLCQLKNSLEQISKEIIGVGKVGNSSNCFALTGGTYSHHPSWIFYDLAKHKEPVKALSLNCELIELDSHWS